MNAGEQKIEEATRYTHGPGLTSIEHNKTLAFVGGLLALSSVAPAISYAQDTRSESRAMSRRKFLGLAGSGTALLVYAATRGGGVGQRPIDAPEITDMFMNGESSTLPGIDWINARNAMSLLKTKDALDRIGGDSGAVSPRATILLGTAHSLGIRSLSASDELCKEAIKKYTGQLFNVIDQYRDRVDSSLDTALAKQLLTEQIARTDMVEFGPQERRQHTERTTVLDEIKSRIKSHQSFSSPRVTSALTTY